MFAIIKLVIMTTMYKGLVEFFFCLKTFHLKVNEKKKMGVSLKTY